MIRGLLTVLLWILATAVLVLLLGALGGIGPRELGLAALVALPIGWFAAKALVRGRPS